MKTPKGEIQGHDLIVVGASAGGVQALKTLVAGLPADLPAAVFVVLHITPEAPSLLAGILDKAGPLPAHTATDKLRYRHGRIYVAPPDQHLLIEPERMRVVRGPRENRHRPSIDVLFRSAAWTHGPRVVSVVLSGSLDDGAAGSWAVKTCGGVCIVQNPEDALFAEMPRNATMVVEPDYLPLVADIPALLIELAYRPAPAVHLAPPVSLKTEVEFAMMDHDIREMNGLGKPTGFTCPNCHGSLWEMHEGELVRYRCHVGHAFSSESLLAEQSIALEEALYSAVRALEEKGAVLRRMAERYLERHPEWSEEYHAKARELDGSADTLRAVLGQHAL